MAPDFFRATDGALPAAAISRPFQLAFSMNHSRLLVSIATAIVCTACATKPAQTTPSTSPAPSVASTTPPSKTVKSRDGSYTGEVAGVPVAGSKFSTLQIGMEMGEVQEIMGRGPERFHTYESGKRWIPFYFGNDARRMQVFYKGEGCLIFSSGGAFGGSGGDLLSITHDAAGACYQP
jgi:hypothetical protein